VRKLPLLMALLIILCIVQVVPVITADTAKDVRLHVSGPNVLGTENTGHYSSTFVDPQGRDWGYEVFLTADNTTGASPLITSPITGNLTGENRSFEFDITAPLTAGDLTINVNLTSKEGNYTYVKTAVIIVVKPVVVHAVVQNPTGYELYNASVRFFIDDEIIDMQTVTVIPPGQYQDISAEWISASIPSGWHYTRVEIDIDNDGVIDTTVGDRVISDKFYVEGGTNPIVWLTILIGLCALLGGVYIINKRKMK